MASDPIHIPGIACSFFFHYIAQTYEKRVDLYWLATQFEIHTYTVKRKHWIDAILACRGSDEPVLDNNIH